MLLAMLLFNCFSCAGAQEKPQSDISSPNPPEIENIAPVPANSHYEGTVLEQKISSGTLNEYSYFFIATEQGRFIIFNSAGKSIGFSKWLNLQVSIQGKPEVGIVGYQGKKVNGIIVETISPVKR